MPNPIPDPPPMNPDPWHGADYAHHSDLQTAMADEVLARIELRGDEQVLDPGCGDGKISARIAERLVTGTLLGVDASTDMIAYAQRQFPAERWTNLRFAVADARRLPFTGRFDLVVSLNALHWVPRQAEALRGIRRALKPTGRARLRLVTRSARTSLEEIAELVRQEPRWIDAFADFTDPYLRLSAAEYVALAERLGFRRVALESAARRWDFHTEEAFLGFCSAGFGAWTHRLPETERRAFVEESMRRYLAVVDAACGERFVFHFTQTDVVLALADAEPARD